jgi:LuxR family maltose regulon positive regulatory protein
MLRALKVGCLFFKDLSDKTVETAEKSIQTISQDNLLALGFAYGILAYGYVQMGELLKAGRPLNASIDIFARIKHSYFLLEMISLRADVERAEGQLRKSDLTLEEAFDRVRRDDFNMTPAVVKLGIRKAYIHYARNQLEEALELARKVNRYVKSIAEPGPLLRAYYIESFVQDAMGHPRQARNLMDEAVAIAADSKSAMRIAMIESYSVELALRQGDLEAAATWAEGRDLSLDGPYSQEIEKECLLMARIHLARGEFREALRLLEKLRPKAEERRRYTAILTMDIVRAAAYWALGEEKKGLAILAEAIEIAQPEGYVRPFVDQSAFIMDMLLALRTSEKGPVRIYIPALIKECMRGAEGSALTEPIDIGYGEVLTPREAEFARLICAGLTNKEIADATFVTMNTVKTHIRHIFGKLGVTTRDEMILRAKDLKLV